MEHQESAGERGKTQPHPQANPRNRTTAPTGDFSRMGHSDSSAHVSGYGGVCGGDERIAEAVAEARSGKLRQDSLRGTLRSAGKWILLLLVGIYQVFLSPFFGGACKFYPSCSKYGYEAIARHGAWRGSVLAVKRLLRCRPFTKGGFDPVPDAEDLTERRAQECATLAGNAERKGFAQ
jgi:putative membrane protein insertion efficiency factor